jgi:lysophospholipase L1-like esterase
LTLHAFGDSITVGYGVAQSYAATLAANLSTPLVNRAVNGAQAGDQAFAAYSFAPNAADVHIVQAGTNDQWRYGADATKLGYFAAALRSLIVTCTAPSKVTARSGGMTFSGSWDNTIVNQIGKNTTGIGNKATAMVSGTAVYVQVILQDHPHAWAKASVKIDGVTVGMIDAMCAGVLTHNGLGYPPGMFRFAGLSDGPHTVEVEVTTSGKYFYVDWIAGSAQSAKPAVYVGNVPRMSAAAYAGLGGSDANVAAYNAAIAAIVAELAGDGLNVHGVDTYAVVSPSSDLLPDGVHPNVGGHLKISGAYLATIQGPPPEFTFTPASVYRRSDGRFFAGDGAERRELTLVP